VSNKTKYHAGNPRPLPTQARLKQLFKYDPSDAAQPLVRRVGGRGVSNLKKGNRAGYKKADGYYAVKVDGWAYQLHRLVYKWHKGRNPKHIDHIDQNRANNKLENVRSVSAADNQRNRSISSHNSSGYPGVSPSRNRWRAILAKNHLGYFDSAQDAYLAYARAAIALGYDSRHFAPKSEHLALLYAELGG